MPTVERPEPRNLAALPEVHSPLIVLRWVRRTVTVLGIDPAVAFVLLANVWVSVFAVFQLLLILRYLSLAEQGVIFNFDPFFQFQVAFDLGFATVIQQLVSHQRAFLDQTPDGLFSGPAGHRARLAALFRIMVKWYLLVLALWTVIMLPAGWLFFRSAPDMAGIAWHLPVILMVVATGWSMVSSGLAKFLSGCGDVLPVTRVTALQLMAAAAGFCAVMVLGGKLLAFPGSQLIGLLFPLVWFVAYRRQLLADLWRARPTPAQLRWVGDVFPFQWRIALSLVSAKAFMLMVPVALRCFGAEAAGRLGVNMNVCIAMQMMGIAWVDTRVPLFGTLIAHKNWARLDREYRHVLLTSTGVLGAILAVMVGSFYFLNQLPAMPAVQELASRFASPAEIQSWLSRFLAPGPFALLALATLATHIFYVRAAYLRAHCREPYLAVAVTQGVVLAITLLLAGLYGTMEYLLGAYLFWSVALGLGWGWWIFHTKRRQWHAPPIQVEAAAPV